MCLGNRAENSAAYINSQLLVQWRNAQRCTEHYGNGRKPEYKEVEFGTALYEFYGPGKSNRYHPSKQDYAFHAHFGVPRIDFVCNHEVVLYIDIRNGHYSTDIEKYTAKSELIEKVENTVLAFRLDFDTHSVNGVECHKIGEGDFTMNLHILDLHTAVFTEELSTLPHITSVTDHKSFQSKERKINALIHYFTKFYFPVLKSAGLHVLHSLPDFDTLSSTSPHIDYSIISKTRLSTNALHGISIDDVNAYLKNLWLQAASYIDEHGCEHSDVSKTYLAELKSTWSEAGEEYDIHVAFGPLQVQAICRREVFLIVDCQEITFQSTITQKDRHKFHGWKLALIIDVDFEEVQSVRRLKLKLKSSRFCEPVSKLPGALADEDLLIRLKTTLVEFIQTTYLTIVEKSQHYYVYQHDTRGETKGVGCSWGAEDCTIDDDSESDDDEEFGCDCDEDHSCHHSFHGEKTIKWRWVERKRITETTITGFDQVSVITQGALNAHFKQLWEAATIRVTSCSKANVRTWSSKHVELETNLAEYGYAEGEHVFFRASFAAPKIQLLVKESGHHQAIFYIQMKDGYLKTLGNSKSLASGNSDNAFNNWILAFTVNLKLVDAHEDTITEAILKLLGRQSKNCFKQLVLDFNHATFNASGSVFSGLMKSEDYVLIRKKREAIVHYIQHHYFPSLVAAGHHILYTIPMFDKSGHNHSGSLTSIKFQLYPFSWGSKTDIVEGVFGKLSYLYSRNMIVLLGMTDHHEMPHGWLPHGLGLISTGSDESRGRISYGSITLSHKEFLGKYVLTALNVLNKKTTILPSFSGVGKGGDWILKLTTWAKHEYKSDLDCKWKIAEGADRSQANINGQELQWIWKNKDEWRYDHEGDLGHNGIYSVKCITRNVLTIPTAYKRGGFSIIVSGHVDIFLTYEGDAGKWSNQMHAKWSGAIKFISDAVHGLRIQVTPATVHPHFEKAHVHQAHFSEATINSVFKQLQENIPSTIDFHSVANSLTLAFNGVKRNLITRSRDLVFVNPVFNRRGDLLLELTARVDAIVEDSAHDGGHAKGHVVPRGSGSVKRSDSWFKSLKREVSEVFHSSKSTTSVTSTTSTVSLSRTSSQVSEKTVVGAQANGNGTTKQQPVKPATPQPAAQQPPVATKV